MSTAKVKCNLKYTRGDQVRLEFVSADDPDAAHADGLYGDLSTRWPHQYTPALVLTMLVRGPLADQFEADGKYTFTFTPTVDDPLPDTKVWH